MSTDDEGPPEVLGVEKMLVARDSAPSDYLQLFAFLKIRIFTKWGKIKRGPNNEQ